MPGYFRLAPHHLQVLAVLITEDPQLPQSLTFTGPAAAGGVGGADGAGGGSATLAPHFSQNLTPSRRA